MKIKNLTTHPLSIHTVSGDVVVIRPSGQTARVSQKNIDAGCLRYGGDEIGVTRTEFGQVEGLPPREEGVIFVVAGMTLAAIEDRPDVFAPGPLVRDGQGRVVGCRGLRQ
jgi:hypothetical protein